MNNKINPRKIFSYNEEVWALAYDFQAAYDCYSNGIPVEDLGHVYGKLNFMPDGVAFEPVTELDTGLYSNKELFGLLSGIQSSPFVQGEHVYSIDNIGSKRDNSQYSVLSMISYDLTTGKGKEICLFPAAYNLTAYTEDMILSFHTDGWRYLGGYRNQAPFDMDQVLLVKTDLTTGEQEVVDLFEPGNRDVYYNTCGAPSGLAYDQDDDLLYYTWNGKLHRRQGLDPETDEVIADAPSSWLKMRYYVDCGYLTDDGYYISVAPDYGIDIIDIKIDGQ